MLHDQCPYLELESDGKGDDFRLVGVNTVTGGGDSLSESEDTTMTSLALWLSQAELVDGRLELLLQHDSCSCSADQTWLSGRDQPHPNCYIFRLIVLFLDNTVQSSPVQSSPWSMFCSVPTKLATKLDTLESQFAESHFEVVDLIEDEGALVKEQTVFDKVDDDINAYSALIQALMFSTTPSRAGTTDELRAAE